MAGITTGSTTARRSTPASALRRQPFPAGPYHNVVQRFACIVIFAVIAILIVACSPTKSEPTIISNTAPRVDVDIEVEQATADRISIGLPMKLELRMTSPDRVVGSCEVSFDLWEETYRVSLSKTQIVHDRDARSALRTCLDMDAVHAARRAATQTGQQFSHIVIARQVERERVLYDDARDTRVW